MIAGQQAPVQGRMEMMRGVIAIIDEQPVAPGADHVATFEQLIARGEAVMLQQIDGNEKPLPDQPGYGGMPALMSAANLGQTAMVQALLKAGAKVDWLDTYGRTALIAAALSGHTAAVHALLQARADCNIKNDEGDTALSLAITREHAGVIELLRVTE